MRLRFTRGALAAWLTGRSPGVPKHAARSAEARQQALRLVREGYAYPCYCTEQELQAMRTRQLAQGQVERYDRRCLSLYAEHRADYEAAGRKPAVRFRVPAGQCLLFEDLVQGPIGFESDRLEDFIILSPEGEATEPLARVLERSTLGVTHVVRDDAHRLDTARELLLYDALDLPAPRFAHLRG